MAVEVLGMVMARGGSKGVPRKNIRLLAGEPLVAYTIGEALRSTYITRRVISTEDAEIAAVAARYGAEVPFLRPAELAEDHVQDLPVIQHCLQALADTEGYRPDIVVHLRPTAPLRRAEHIDAGVALLLATPEADCVRSVTPAPQHPLKMWRIVDDRLQPFVPEEVYGIAAAYNMPRQRLPAAYVQNGSVDVVRTATITEKQSMTGSVIVPLLMEEADSVNIDSLSDWERAEVLMQQRKPAVQA